MRGMNRIMLVGRVGSDLELRISRAGNPWGHLSLATNRPRKTEDGWSEDTDWHRVKVFGSLAERCQKVVRKGALVCVEGSMTYERFEAEDGHSVRYANVLADRVEVLVFAPRDNNTDPHQAPDGWEPLMDQDEAQPATA